MRSRKQIDNAVDLLAKALAASFDEEQRGMEPGAIRYIIMGSLGAINWVTEQEGREGVTMTFEELLFDLSNYIGDRDEAED